MKILNFVACMMLPVSIIINSGYAMEDTGFNNPILNIDQMNDTIEYKNPIFKILNNSHDNTVLNSYIENNNNKPENTNIDISNINVSNLKNNINAKYENLMNEILELSHLVSSNNRNISTYDITNIINNLFDDINNKNKNIIIMSLKQIYNQYYNSNIPNIINNSNIYTEYEVVELIKSISSCFFKCMDYKKEIENIDKISTELTYEINGIINQIINSNNKYSGAIAKVIVNKDLEKRNKLECEKQTLEIKYNNDKNRILRLLNLNSNIDSENFINNILKDLYNKQDKEITSLYGILINTKYTNSNVCCNIYDNIVYRGLDHSYKIVTCLENILRIKDEISQTWNKFNNNKKIVINNKDKQNNKVDLNVVNNLYPNKNISNNENKFSSNNNLCNNMLDNNNKSLCNDIINKSNFNLSNISFCESKYFENENKNETNKNNNL